MYGEYHEVPYKSNVQEAIIGPFSWRQLLWLAPGVMGTYQFATHIPKLPMDSLLFSRVHWLIPIIISLIFAYFKDHKTNLSLFGLIVTKTKLLFRNRTFYYRRKNMPSVNEVENR